MVLAGLYLIDITALVMIVYKVGKWPSEEQTSSCLSVYVTRFAKTTFLKIQIFASWCSAYLKTSAVAVSNL